MTLLARCQQGLFVEVEHDRSPVRNLVENARSFLCFNRGNGVTGLWEGELLDDSELAVASQTSKPTTLYETMDAATSGEESKARTPDC